MQRSGALPGQALHAWFLELVLTQVVMITVAAHVRLVPDIPEGAPSKTAGCPLPSEVWGIGCRPSRLAV